VTSIIRTPTLPDAPNNPSNGRQFTPLPAPRRDYDASARIDSLAYAAGMLRGAAEARKEPCR